MPDMAVQDEFIACVPGRVENLWFAWVVIREKPVTKVGNCFQSGECSVVSRAYASRSHPCRKA